MFVGGVEGAREGATPLLGVGRCGVRGAALHPESGRPVSRNRVRPGAAGLRWEAVSRHEGRGPLAAGKPDLTPPFPGGLGPPQVQQPRAARAQVPGVSGGVGRSGRARGAEGAGRSELESGSPTLSGRLASQVLLLCTDGLFYVCPEFFVVRVSIKPLSFSFSVAFQCLWVAVLIFYSNWKHSLVFVASSETPN